MYLERIFMIFQEELFLEANAESKMHEIKDEIEFILYFRFNISFKNQDVTLSKY